LVEGNSVFEYMAWERDFVASESALNRALTQLSSNLVADDHSIEQMALEVLDHARALTGSEHGFVSEIDPQTRQNVGYTLTAMMGEACQIDGEQRRIRFSPRDDGTYPGLWGQALNTRRSFFLNDVAAGDVSTPVGHIPIARFLSVPVLFRGELLGQIALANPRRAYRRDDIETVERLAELFAIAIHRRREMERTTALEFHLSQAQKLEALGQLTGGVAHDFNNLLSVIAGSLELLQDESTDEALRRELLSDALQAVESGAVLTARLLAFARRQPLSARPTNLCALIGQLEHLLRRTLTEGIRLRCHCEAGLWAVHVDPNQIEHGLLNLAINARDAMPNGGALTITAENLHLDGAEQDRFPGISAGAYVVVSVADTGIGMSPEVRERALEPFFTTKATGKGTGLGLSMVYGLVRQLGGDLRIESSEGNGTVIRLFLPRAETTSQVGDEASRTGAESADRARILVVEDDPRLRKVTVNMLKLGRYDIIEAANSQEALDYFKRHDGLDLLCTDVQLPGGMNGVDLVAAIRADKPDLKVIYVSGYTEDDVRACAQLHTGVRMIGKPFRRDELLATVRELLATRSPRGAVEGSGSERSTEAGARSA
jgi:Signal transduction histidine kinase regulating C4-dicarboxylate transport system